MRNSPEHLVLITGEDGVVVLPAAAPQVETTDLDRHATRQPDGDLLEEIGAFGELPPGIQQAAGARRGTCYLHAVRARGQWAVLLLDEAQNLAMDLLEEIRLLSNAEVEGEKLLQIFLVGHPSSS